MKRLTPALLLIPFLIIGFFSFRGDSDNDYGHKIGRYYINVPDSMPAYNGLYWANKHNDTLDIQPYNSREYQIELNIDSTEIWDGNRLVGKMAYDSTAVFDSIMIKDNE